MKFIMYFFSENKQNLKIKYKFHIFSFPYIKVRSDPNTCFLITSYR